MKKGSKVAFIFSLIFLLAFSYLSVFGLSNYKADTKQVYIKGIEDIRWGIDIQGGVEAIFKPDVKDLKTISKEDMVKAENIIKVRLVNNNITDSEVVKDDVNKQIIVRFPWKSGEKDFDPAKTVEELGSMAVLTFCENTDQSKVILTGTDVKSASAGVDNDNKNVVNLVFKSSGKTKFAEATTRLVNQTISIWLDQDMISNATVNTAITDGRAVISGSFTPDEAQDLAELINAGSLPFAMTSDNSKLQVVSPTLGQESLNVMLVAGLITFVLIIIMLLVLYKVPGFVGVISITAQIAGIFACVSGFFGPMLFGTNSYTLTIPGIAGIILSIGMGVDANVITAERVKEEIRLGKSIDGSIEAGFERGFSAILDGNVTVVIVAIILMGAFGAPGSLSSTIVSPLFFFFPPAISSAISSFGLTLFIGMIFNMVVGVGFTRIMLRGISRFKSLRKPWLFGGYKNEK